MTTGKNKQRRGTPCGKGKASRKKGHTMNYKQLHDVLAGVALILTLVTTFVVCGFLEAVL